MSTSNLQMIEGLLDRLTVEEQIVVIERLAHKLRASVRSNAPKSLYGVWRERFSQDFDIDVALGQIRGNWESEWTPSQEN